MKKFFLCHRRVGMLGLLILLLLCGETAARQSKDSGKKFDRVLSLPGQPKVQFGQYSGYITVDELHGRALFYWFLEAVAEPTMKPLVLWLNGGPGCSSIGAGASIELGPFLVNTNGTGLHLNKHSWNNEANMLFLESPVGVGFSYTNTSSDLDHLDDENTAQNAYLFIVKWFERFPEYKSHEFYLAGESYAGHYVPQLAELVFDGNKRSSSNNFYINLKGFIVGNAATDDFHDWIGIIEYAWSHAVISDRLYQAVIKTCDFTLHQWTENCTRLVGEVFAQYNEIDIYNLYMPSCLKNSSSTASMSQNTYSDRVSKGPQKQRAALPRHRFPGTGYDPCFQDYVNIYFNRRDVQEAFHVNGIPRKWLMCSDDILSAYNNSAFTLLPTYTKLINSGLRIWLYSGDIDGRIPVTSTRYTLNALGLPIKEDWHPWYHKNQVAGRVIEYKGLSFVTIRGAGHLVPLNKPSEALRMFGSYLKDKSLPKKRY